VVAVDHYVEIRLLPDPEFQETMLMSALFAKLHRALAADRQGDVGISFPQAQKTLGDTIRLHGSSSNLERIMNLNWIKGLTDHANVSPILAVPAPCRYRNVKRVQAKSSVERLYRRSVKKGWLTEEEAEMKVAESKEQYLKQPFVQIKSSSTGQMFRLFIQQSKLSDVPREGKFTAYGLSDQATIPWF
jgi:CRISPR-associated endonuclease Csy4